MKFLSPFSADERSLLLRKKRQKVNGEEDNEEKERIILSSGGILHRDINAITVRSILVVTKYTSQRSAIALVFHIKKEKKTKENKKKIYIYIYIKLA